MNSSNQKPRKKWVPAVVLLAVVLCAGIAYQTVVTNYRTAVGKIKIEGIDLTGKADGIYEGAVDTILVVAKVSVVVKDSRIKEIRIIEHKNGKGAPAEAVLDKVIAQQTTEVDMVSGATNSSRVLLEAIENALAAPPVS